MHEYTALEHNSTVVTVSNKAELRYVLTWAEESGRQVSGYMWDRDTFPYCLSLCGEIVGWVDRMDRALYYKSFSEFLKDIGE